MGADVFFIHPTTYLSSVMGNAAFDVAGETTARVDDVVLRFQASVFNGCCRIFAPRYRQASLHAVTTDSAEAYAIDDLAYGDVARAFAAFLQQTGDRPFIIASHSQGSIHAMRLLQERIIGTPLQKRLVAAYVIGVALPTQIEQRGLPVCQSAAQTGCVITWNSVRSGHDDRRRKQDAVIWWEGRYQPIAGRPLVCVNPLNWQRNTAAGADMNLGGVYNAGRDASIPAPVVGLTGAACEDGLLGVDIPREQRRRFGDMLTLIGVYHDFDYGLFYMNLRNNAVERVRAFQSGDAASLQSHSRSSVEPVH
jgi:pimeloyl-ACP methyl ester carboxylesterase